MSDDRIRTPETVVAPETSFAASSPAATKIPLTPQDRARLMGQIDHWRKIGLMSDNQAHAILDLYEERWESQVRTHNVAIFVLMSIAAFLVGLAVILVISFNWEAMPAAIKLAVLIGGVAGMHGLGFWLKFGKRWDRSAEIAFFFGCVIYGASIWLIAQIFNLDSHWPDGFWWWAWGILPFALLLDTVLVHLLLVAVLGVWVSSEIFSAPAFLFGRFHTWPPAGAFTLPIFAFLPLWWAYRKNQVAAVWLYVPLVMYWAALQPVAWHFVDQVVFFLGALASLSLLVAELHGEGNRFAIPYRLFGLMLLFGVLTPLTFWSFNLSFFGDREWGLWALIPGLAMSCLGVGAVAIAFLVGRRRTSTLEVSGTRATFVRLWLPAGLTLAFGAMSYLHLWAGEFGMNQGGGGLDVVRHGYALFVTLLANAFFLAAAFWTMWLGLREERGLPFAGGVAAFLLWTILRYVDLFADFGGMLGAALMFFLCGAVLFGVAIYWGRRKRIRHER